MKWKWIVGAVVAGVLVGVVVVVGGRWINREVDLVNPIGKRTGWLGLGSGSSYEVVAFLPPWLIDRAKLQSKEIDQLVFLGVEADSKGNLIWDSQAKKVDGEAYEKLKGQMRRWRKKNILGIKLFDDERLDKLLANNGARLNLVGQIKEAVEKRKFDGVNIDFEYQGDPLAILDDKFVGWLGELRSAEVGEIGVDVFANTIIKGEVEKIRRLAGAADWVIVMAYDFHRPGMDWAGAVAPVGSEAGERNIGEVVEKIKVGGIEKTKMIMAYPLYGYEWKTYSEDFGAQIRRGWYATASLSRVNELLKDTTFIGNARLGWDEVSQTPWMIYKSPETRTVTKRVGKKLVKSEVVEEVIHQIYYDDVRSLGIKYKLVTDNRLGGVGFWALGYEGENLEMWMGLEKIINDG